MTRYQTVAIPHQHEKKEYKDIYLCKTHQQDQLKGKALQQIGIDKDTITSIKQAIIKQARRGLYRQCRLSDCESLLQ
jgi:hypothetical protein